MRGKGFGSGRLRTAAAVVSLAVIGGAVFAAPAPAAEPCTEPPEVFPVAELEDGMTGTAWTVVKGRTPVPMDVEILGVQPDGIAPGVDFILVQLSGPVIDETGGIAFGMSGSPVYIDDKLVGALAYGFFAADHTIAGVTPAQPMVDILSYPGAALARHAKTVTMTGDLREAAAGASGEPKSSFSTASQLRVPLAVGGVNDRGLGLVQEAIDRGGLPLVAYRAGTKGASGTAVTPIGPGESFASALSYGDLTLAGIGTATATCGDLAVAFGHPFFWTGPTQMGMSAADVITVIKDPSSLFGPFKMANVAELHGTVDQDRLAGIRGIEGLMPSLIPVTSDIENPDLPKFHAGETEIVDQSANPVLWFDFPYLTFLTLFTSQDVAFDRIGDGSLILEWTISGLRESGEPFTVHRGDVYFSRWDISIDGLFELWGQLDTLEHNGFEDITFTGVDTQQVITGDELRSRVTRVLTASSLRPYLKERKTLKVARSDTIRMRVFFQPAEGGPEQAVDLDMKVRGKAGKKGTLTLRGGKAGFGYFDEDFFFEGGEPEPDEGSLDDLIASLEGGEHRSDVVATLKGLRARKVTSQQDFIPRGKKVVTVVVKK
jgi:hypothetical protein